MRLTIAGCVLGAVLLAGCTARLAPTKVEVEGGVPVKIEVGDGGGFCPPGQRKKGNC